MTESKKETSEKSTGKAVKEDLEQGEVTPLNAEIVGENELHQDQKSFEKDYLYLRAEFENYKKQAIKERSLLLRYGAERLAFDLLDTIDIFHSALENKVTAENYEEYIKGVELTAQSLRSTLEKHGIKEISCIGEAFDPNTHEALSSEVTDKVPAGHISQVFKAPFNYHDKLLRPGQVIVAREKTSKE